MLQQRCEHVEVLEIVANPYGRSLWRGRRPHLKFLPELAALTTWNVAPKGGRLDRKQLTKLSAQRIAAVVEDFRPKVFITSRFAGVAGELLDVYPILKGLSSRIIVGWRDILSSDDPIDLLDEYVDQVVVFGLERYKQYLPLNQLPRRLRRGVRFVGYIPPLDRFCPAPVTRVRLGNRNAVRILCQVGGGVDGATVIRSCVAAVEDLSSLDKERKVELEIARGILSPSNAEGFSTSELRGCVRSARWRQLNQSRYSSYDLQVAMAGYNTCVEAAFFKVPSILLPRQDHADKEQVLRANLFSSCFKNIFAYGRDSPVPPNNSLTQLIQDIIATSAEKYEQNQSTFFANARDLASNIN
jgi:predicted glycosyltransferase